MPRKYTRRILVSIPQNVVDDIMKEMKAECYATGCGTDDYKLPKDMDYKEFKRRFTKVLWMEVRRF